MDSNQTVTSNAAHQEASFNEDFFSFISEHRNDDIARLRLKHWNNPNFSPSLAITQIEVRNKIKHKLPTWYRHERIVFPSAISGEQCSSEATAQYKQSLVRGDTLCDLTGGLGIDCYFMAQRVAHATYVEQNEFYCSVARHNFKLLDCYNIKVVNSDCNDFLSRANSHFDTIYIDPARRSTTKQRIYAVKDCEPNVLALLPLLLSKSKRLIIKLSPMVDISAIRQELRVGCTIHIVSFRNECKEILISIDTDKTELHGQPVECALIDNNNCIKTYLFDSVVEAQLPYRIHSGILAGYLYEPDAALLKAGAFKSIADCYGIDKVHKSSHLYTSSILIGNFPGRCFNILEVIPFSSSVCKSFSKIYPFCNITTRNFPLTAATLRQKLKVKDGGDTYLFATTASNDQRILIVCRKT